MGCRSLVGNLPNDGLWDVEVIVGSIPNDGLWDVEVIVGSLPNDGLWQSTAGLPWTTESLEIKRQCSEHA